jgi:hypothetical protein
LLTKDLIKILRDLSIEDIKTINNELINTLRIEMIDNYVLHKNEIEYYLKNDFGNIEYIHSNHFIQYYNGSHLKIIIYHNEPHCGYIFERNLLLFMDKFNLSYHKSLEIYLFYIQ